MSKSFSISSWLIVGGIPLFIILFSILLSQSSWFLANPDSLAMGITFDLALTTPLIYLILIRKRNIPKITVVPFFMGGILIASYIIPSAHQFFLIQLRTWLVPVVEIGVLAFIGFRIWQLRKSYKNQKELTLDFYEAFQKSAREILPQKIASFLAMEIAAFYYGFIYWKKRPLRSQEFSYHRFSGTQALLAVFIFLILIETLALHLLLHFLVSATLAWVLSILGLYTALQMFGLVRSMPKRPIRITEDKLLIRYGIMAEASIPLENIEQISLASQGIDFDKEVRQLSPFGTMEGYNVYIQLKEPETLIGLYGMKKSFKALAFYVDEKEEFINAINLFTHHLH